MGPYFAKMCPIGVPSAFRLERGWDADWLNGTPMERRLVGPSRKGSLTKTGSSKDHHPAPNYVARLFRLESGKKSKVQHPKMISPNLEFSGHVSPSTPHPFLFISNFKPSSSMDFSYSMNYFAKYHC